MTDIIIKEKTLEAPINMVWEAITDARQISEWFIQADFKAEVGYNYTLTHEKTKIRGKVIKANPVHTLEYSWSVNEAPATTVLWELQEDGDTTKLKLTHSGISIHGEAAAEFFGHFSKGWDNCITGLTEYFVKSKVD